MTKEEFALELEPLIAAVSENTDKQQEILERLECIDNKLDDWNKEDPAVELAEAQLEHILIALAKISRQLG